MTFDVFRFSPFRNEIAVHIVVQTLFYNCTIIFSRQISRIRSVLSQWQAFPNIYCAPCPLSHTHRAVSYSAVSKSVVS